MNRFIVPFVFILVLIGPMIGTAIESAARPTQDDYPHYYMMEECLPYRVISESSRPEWFEEEEDAWFDSDSFLSEQELLSCEYIKRIN